ncbi:hypothetical protein A2524_02200 [Candidatus Wolfebacteria bacterium RIFOXYD12_FULL_48_21]|uniref:Uncharacterized protein n=1 Tax=Candidatus Wolfebacteria bacterium RIFOXYD1_FULL_48_65 TaxID=1802561 RepID=A0A1F8E6E6_9BACT|nr:MAG: hypothetical protein A2524_02200 [Candidatus Wolfebacteria bacterium RIFOXYD12_FULL_48_21]OGM95535.1 MAG: hypothetical protein A2610_01995 [Candidatus Wolfebacteria bacterium RIFOXYD1_FULL_48_65]
MEQQIEPVAPPSETPWATIKNGRIIAEVGTTIRIPMGLIRPNPKQPRKFFDKAELEATALSYKHRNDVEQPIPVTLRDENRHALIVDGGSRYLAAQIAKLEGLSCYIKPPMTDDEVYLSSAVANIRRKSFSVVEIALALDELMERFGINQTEAGEKLGMTPSQVTYHLTFLNLIEEIHWCLMRKEIGHGVAFQLAKFEHDDQKKMLSRIKDAVKKNGGKPIHPNKVARLLRSEAERLGIVPRRGSRGRGHVTHAKLVGNHVVKEIEHVIKAFAELKELTHADLQELRDPSAIDIQMDLLELQKKLAVALRQFDHIT